MLIIAPMVSNLTKTTRVVLADDDVLLREGLARILAQAGFEVVGQIGTAAGLTEVVEEHQPELCVIDIRMPPTHRDEGLEAARAIRERFPEIAIVILSAHVLVEPATELLATGGRTGYLLKRRVSDVGEFVTTLREILAGASIVDPSLVQELIEMKRLDDPLDSLSPRERDVLAAMAEGRSNAGIAQSLFISEGTLEKHIHSIFMKLRLPDTELDHRRVLAVIKYLKSR
jgi:DNA-binding NarL/FixJ family response regulator